MTRKINLPSESDLPPRSWQPYSDMHLERIRAHKKHEAKDGSMEVKDFNNPIWLAVLGEEFGEVARVLCEDELGNLLEVKPKLREELVQLGAMTAAWIDAIDLDASGPIMRKDVARENMGFESPKIPPWLKDTIEKATSVPTDKESQQIAEAKTWAKNQVNKPYRWGVPSPLFGEQVYHTGGFVKALLDYGKAFSEAATEDNKHQLYNFVQQENIKDSLTQLSLCNSGGPGECPVCTDRVKWIMEQLGIDDE